MEEVVSLAAMNSINSSNVAWRAKIRTFMGWFYLKKTKEATVQLRNKISHLKEDIGEKIFDPDAPLLIADALIREQFLWNEQHKTLHYCSDIFWRWDGMKYVELSSRGNNSAINEGMTSLDIATRTSDLNLAILMLEHGADATLLRKVEFNSRTNPDYYKKDIEEPYLVGQQISFDR